MRDRERPVERTGAARLVAIGDSITFGSRVSAPDRFTEQLEILVGGGLGRAVEVLNLGVGGYDTLQAVATLEDVGLRFAPDLVIVGYCLNDVGENSPNLEYIERLHETRSRLHRLRVVQLLSTGIERLLLMWRLTRVNQDQLFAEQNRRFIVPVSGDRELMALREELAGRTDADELMLSWYRSEAHLGKLAYALDRLAGVARSHGLPVLVAIIPLLEAKESYDVVYRMVEHMVVERGLEAVVLASAFPRAELESLRPDPRDRMHPNERGHRLIAEALAPLVVAKLRSLGGSAARPTSSAARVRP
jgi:lysophospholipase L1-like esterase